MMRHMVVFSAHSAIERTSWIELITECLEAVDPKKKKRSIAALPIPAPSRRRAGDSDTRQEKENEEKMETKEVSALEPASLLLLHPNQ